MNNKTTNPSTRRVNTSRERLIEQGGERLEVRLQPKAARHQRAIMNARGIRSKTDLIHVLLMEEAKRVSID